MANPFKLTDIQKRAVFKTLATKSQYQTGLHFDFQKYYKSNVQIINAVRKIYTDVKENLEEYGVSQELLEMVEDGMKTRRDQQGTAAMVPVMEGAVNEKTLVLGARTKAWTALNRKLDGILRSNKELKGISLSQLGVLAGISFDKAQIVEGKATEHIVMNAKIEKDMTVDELMSQIMRNRETYVQEDK